MKYEGVRIEPTEERLRTLAEVCRNVHGEECAERALEMVRRRGHINVAQRLFGLHYRADFARSRRSPSWARRRRPIPVVPVIVRATGRPIYKPLGNRGRNMEDTDHHVQAGAHRQSRRDRAARHPRLPRARDRDGRGLLRGRRRLAAPGAGRPNASASAGRGAPRATSTWRRSCRRPSRPTAARSIRATASWPRTRSSPSCASRRR